MSDVKKLIERITADVMRKAAKSVQEKIYRDEPLIFTASQMKSYVPDEIKQMKKIASEPSAYYMTEANIFYRQAKFMEGYEDDFEYNENFFTYFPTYQRMNTGQLRGYFSWRTKVRRGEIRKTSLSFVYVYIYELINMIGSASPEEGFGKFRDLCEEYSKLDPAILRYAKTWLLNFAVYYNIDKEMLDGLVDTGFDRNVSVLKNYEAFSEEEVFEAICSLSSYNIMNYKLYKLFPGDVRSVTCGVFRQCSEYYMKNRKKSFCDKLFGAVVKMQYQLFEAAVFYDRKKYTDYTYEITDSHKYYCKNGRWYCERYYGNKKSKQLGEILKSIDSIMREKLAQGNPIASPCETKWIMSIINKEIDDLIENKKKNAAPKIEIDVSKLAGIRKAADITRDRLLTEEERDTSEEKVLPVEAEEASDPVSDEAAEIFCTEEKFLPANNTPLNDDEYGFLHSLLYGGSFGSRIMPSILADSVNEKLFDEFGDVLIIFEGDKPVVIEDYADDLKGMIPE